MGSGGAGERPGEAFVAACWGERRHGAHLQGRAAAGGRQGAAGAHPGPAGLPEVGRVVPTDAWQGGCGATAGEKQSRRDPPGQGQHSPGQGGRRQVCASPAPRARCSGHRARPARLLAWLGKLQNRLLCSPCMCPPLHPQHKKDPCSPGTHRPGQVDVLLCCHLPPSPLRASGLPQQDTRTGPMSPHAMGDRAPHRPAARTFAGGGRGCCKVPPRNGAG